MTALDQDAEFVRLYELGWSGHAIARRFNLSHEFVYKRLRQLTTIRSRSKALKIYYRRKYDSSHPFIPTGHEVGKREAGAK